MSGISSLETFVFIIFVFNACVSVTQAGLVYCVCGTAGNYTNNSIYENNLNSAVTYLAAAANTSNYGFYNASVGENTDTVNTLVLCRSDVQPDICRSCIRDSVNKSRELCPNQKEALVWYDECMFRYSDRSIFNNVDTQPIIFVSNVNNASNPDEFSKDLGDLFDNLKGRAIQEKFAAGIISGPDSVTIYGLMQCTPDLSSAQCGACLDEVMGALPSCCSRNIGGQILSPSCKLIFEESRFFNGTLYDASRPPPPPSPPPKLSPPLPVSPPPSPVPPPGKDDNTAQTVIIIVVVVVVVVTLAILLLILVCSFKRKQKQRTTVTEESKNDNVEDINSVESLQYDFATIEVATDYFSDSNKLGQGGFGAVYKGMLPNGKEVAVKRLSRGSAQGEQEFKNEIMLVARLQHRNLVRLLGFCYEGTERLLIYEFVPNASLDQFIFDSVKRSYLDWERRYKILGGVAKGILYLHEDSRLRIIHRDLKASNVLLDAEMNPKIADFGMAKLFDFDETQGNTNRIVGTYGYMAPEYALYGLFSVKSDVFSFGMLVLEIVSGRKNHSFQNEDNTEDLASFAWKNWREGTASSVIDPLLRDSSGSVREMIRCIHIGLLCVQENVTDRPTMASVMLMLNSFSINLAVPSVPGFFVPNRIDPAATLHGDNKKSKLSGSSIKANEKFVDFSINEASITDLYPR